MNRLSGLLTYTYHLHFQTPRESLNDLPIETDSSGHPESERRGTPIPFPISDNDDVRQTNEHTVHFGADTLHSEIFPFTTDDAIHYLEDLSYDLSGDHIDAIISLADLLADDAKLTRVDVVKAVKLIPDLPRRKSIGELCFQKILKDKRKDDRKSDDIQSNNPKSAGQKEDRVPTRRGLDVVYEYPEPRHPTPTLMVNMSDQPMLNSIVEYSEWFTKAVAWKNLIGDAFNAARLVHPVLLKRLTSKQGSQHLSVESRPTIEDIANACVTDLHGKNSQHELVTIFANAVHFTGLNKEHDTHDNRLTAIRKILAMLDSFNSNLDIAKSLHPDQDLDKAVSKVVERLWADFGIDAPCYKRLIRETLDESESSGTSNHPVTITQLISNFQVCAEKCLESKRSCIKFGVRESSFSTGLSPNQRRNQNRNQRNEKDDPKMETSDQKNQPICFACGAANHTTGDGHECRINPATGEKYENKAGKRHPIAQEARDKYMAAREPKDDQNRNDSPKRKRVSFARDLTSINPSFAQKPTSINAVKTDEKSEKQKIHNVEKRPDYTLLRAHHLDALDTESEVLESSTVESLNAVEVLLDTGNRSNDNLISYDCARRLNLSKQLLDNPVELETFCTDLTHTCTEHTVVRLALPILHDGNETFNFNIELKCLLVKNLSHNVWESVVFTKSKTKKLSEITLLNLILFR